MIISIIAIKFNLTQLSNTSFVVHSLKKIIAAVRKVLF